MLKINNKKIKSYGDRLDDGHIQLSFTLPVKASPEAKEAARLYAERLNLKNVSISTMEPMGDDFTFFVAYGQASHSINFTKITVPKVDSSVMDFKTLSMFMDEHLKKRVVVIGGTIGTDAHTVGIDAIMNMKGYDQDYGLERYSNFDAHNLRSQIDSAHLIEKAVELKADAILISQIVTQRDSHIKNMKEFLSLAKADKRLSKDVILIVGGPRIDHALAIKLGYDAGFGTGTRPSQVASFIVKEYMKRHKSEIKEVVAQKKDSPKPQKSDEKSQKPSPKNHHRRRYSKKKPFNKEENKKH